MSEILNRLLGTQGMNDDERRKNRAQRRCVGDARQLLKVRQAMLAYVHKRRIADFPESDTYFFLSKGRRPVTNACIGSLMLRLKKRTGIARLHAHLFRHTFATNFLVHGLGDVYELSRILGHSEIRVTESYLQLASYYTIIEKRRKLSYMDMQL